MGRVVGTHPGIQCFCLVLMHVCMKEYVMIHLLHRWQLQQERMWKNACKRSLKTFSMNATTLFHVPGLVQFLLSMCVNCIFAVEECVRFYSL